MRPTLIINRHDYSALAEEINLTWNDLDADGSGRDIHSGLMYRNKITSKLQLTVTMLDMYEDDVRKLSQDLEPQYVDATVLDPVTNKVVTKTFYCSSINYGAQLYARVMNKAKYIGVSFELAER